MATTLTDLLDTLHAETTRNDGAVDPADADRAIALLGRTLRRLADDGLSPTLGTDRERWVIETARASTRAAPGPDPVVAAGGGGRLTQLAGAAADVVGLMRAEVGCGQRWAIATAVVDEVARLTTAANYGDMSDERRRALIVADAAATVVQRLAALDPPSRPDSVPLDWAIPAPSPVSSASRSVVVSEAIAGLEHAARRLDGALPVAGYVTVCTALESLCRTAASLADHDEPRLATAADLAGQGWAAARAVLNPFDDGSRRPHDVAPPTVSYALQLRSALQLHEGLRGLALAGESSAGPLTGAVRGALQRVPAVADHLSATLRHWGINGGVLAYARDLPLRETRITEHLAGFCDAGLVRADSHDFEPAHAALHGATVLSVDLATQAQPRSRLGPAVTHLAASHRDGRGQLTEQQLQSAAADARRALQAFAGPPRGGRGPRR